MFIIKIDFNEGQQPFYYVLANEDNWEEIYNPHFATQFKTAEEATEWIEESMTWCKDQAIAVGAVSTIAKYDKWIKGPATRRIFEYFSDELNVKFDRKKHDRIDALNWWFEYKNSPNIDTAVKREVYRSYPDLYEVFECLWGVQRYEKYPYTEKSVTVEMRVGKDTSFKTFKEELDLVAGRINRRDDDGSLIISIFDRFLGEGGNFAYFKIRENGKYAICSRFSDYIEGTLEEVFKYWKKERYYD